MVIQYAGGEGKVKPLKEKVCITLDNEILQKIRELAELDDRSVSSYINLVLKKHLEESKQKIGA